MNNTIKLLLSLLILVFPVSTISSQEFTRVMMWKKKADKGDLEAAYELAKYFNKYWSSDKYSDNRYKKEWYTKAYPLIKKKADNGDIRAMMDLAICHRNHYGVTQRNSKWVDIDKKIRQTLLQRIEQDDDAEAMMLYGKFYDSMEHLEMAAKKGNPEGMYLLALQYGPITYV